MLLLHGKDVLPGIEDLIVVSSRQFYLNIVSIETFGRYDHTVRTTGYICRRQRESHIRKLNSRLILAFSARWLRHMLNLALTQIVHTHTRSAPLPSRLPQARHLNARTPRKRNFSYEYFRAPRLREMARNERGSTWRIVCKQSNQAFGATRLRQWRRSERLSFLELWSVLQDGGNDPAWLLG
jgi:hypothetical protein